jgi:hypothetical protein
MREHGVTNFPDPNSKGAIQIESHPGHEIDIASPTFKSADEACKPLLPNPVTADQQTALRAAGLKYAKCMRGHGVKDFPDPASAGNNSGPQSQSQAGGSGHVISFMGSPVHDDPNDPTYKAADASCKHYMADAGGGEQSTNSSGTG